MPYMSLYRKYRPQNFEQIVGQNAIVTTLKNQVESGEISHAYLFCGMRGTGKTTTARVFAKALNCQNGPTSNPCNNCYTCMAINAGSMMDVIEMDAASNRGIDDIRDLREKVNFPPTEGRYKIYIIDEVHMLTTEAFNALLKTLEEPPRHVVFILATTEPNKLLPTILSRCMRFDFTRVSARDIVKRLKDVMVDLNACPDDKALAEIAANSQGSVRDALSLLEKAISFGGKDFSHDDVLNMLGAVSMDVFHEITRAVQNKDSSMVLKITDRIIAQGKDLIRFSSDLQKHFRNILMVCIGAGRNLIDVMDEDYEVIKNASKSFTKESLLAMINILRGAENDLKWSAQPRVVLEAALVKLTIPLLWEGIEGCISRIEELERRIDSLERSKSSSKNDSSPISIQPQSDIQLDKKDEDNTDDNTVDESEIEEVETEHKKHAHKEHADVTDSETDLKRIRQLWPDVVERLGEKRKKRLQVTINEGEVFPVEVDGNKIYLCCQKGDFYKEIIEAEKNNIEEAIKEVTGFDLCIKGFKKPNQTNTSGGKIKPINSEMIQIAGTIDKICRIKNFAKESQIFLGLK
jgi:DNA polymerase-3 subunit gamma/tau